MAGLTVSVHDGKIYVDGKRLYTIPDELNEIIYKKRNRLIDNGGSTFLFLEVNGSPNADRLLVYKIGKNKVDSVADAISSDLFDMDGDSCPEFGGRDLTEQHPSGDSMYYYPSRYYEIRNGKVVFDSSLTRDMDLRMNGVYLPYPSYIGDDGNCCKVILKPGKKAVDKVPLVHPLIVSERIDGPANIRDSIHGRAFLQLYDNVPVSTQDSSHQWYRIGLTVGLSDDQYKRRMIRKGAFIWTKEQEVGKALAEIPLSDTYKDEYGLYGIIDGYTAVQNIKPQTLPENVLSDTLKGNAAVTEAQLQDLMTGFRFSLRMLGGYRCFQLDGGVVYGPSAPMRFLLVFDKGRLFAVVHLRRMQYQGEVERTMDRGYLLTVVGRRASGRGPDVKVEAFVKAFNEMIDKAD